MESMFGYRSDELLGQPVECLIPLNFRERHPGHRKEFGQQKETRPMGLGNELFGLRQDGTEFPVEIGLNPIDALGGGVVLASVVDISARAAAAAKLEQSVKNLAAANAELEEFSSVASHDLQEPIRNLLSYVALLQEDLPGDLPPDAVQDLEYIKRSAARMQELVQDLLTLSRVGRRELEVGDVVLEDCVKESLAALDVALRESDAVCEFARLPNVRGDRRLLTQLYQNLISNANKFRQKGTSPKIQLTAERGPLGEWVFGVRDNGIGIPPQYAEEVFTPFKRLHGRQQYGGSGVGLAICRKAVERHGGRIWVESELGQGAYFQFTLPARTVFEGGPGE
jgi:PAS domain S-box-containing protein